MRLKEIWVQVQLHDRELRDGVCYRMHLLVAHQEIEKLGGVHYQRLGEP